MKIAIAPKTFKILRGSIILIAIVLVAYVAYAATQLSVNNSVTITAANGIGVSITTSNPGTCPALNSGSYQVATFTNTNTWSIPAGGSTSQFFCLENTGTGNDPTPSIALSTTTVVGLTVATTPTTISAINAGSVSAPITVTASVPASSTGSGTFSLTVS
jgi:hypothetical protein